MNSNGFDKFAYVKSLRGIEMTLAQRCVLLQVWDYSQADGTHAFAGVKRIAEDLGINERTVRRSLQWLCEAGWLRKDKPGGRSGDGSHWASTYSLTVPVQPDIDDSQPDIDDSQPDIDARSTGPQTLPTEPLTKPETTNPETTNPSDQVIERFPGHDKSNGYHAGCIECEYYGFVCDDHRTSELNPRRTAGLHASV